MSDLKDLCFIDCETGGLDPATSSIIEIAAVRVDPITLETKSALHRAVKPILTVGVEAAKVNGYSPEKWAERGAVTCAQMLSELEEIGILHSAIPAGQNPAFDMKFLRHWWTTLQERGELHNDFPKMDYHLIDVATLVVPLWTTGLIPGLSLRHTSPLFGLGEQRHDAMSDVRQTIEVFRHVVKKIYEPAVVGYFGRSTSS